MSKLLDLRDRGIDRVKVVEKIIFKPRSFGSEMVRLFSVIVIVLAIGFGISNADNLNPFMESGIETATENFSSLGIVSEVTESSITLTDAKGSDKSGDTTYNLDITHLEKVETNTNTPLIITDIKIGDTIIAQGLTNGTKFFIKRIVSFGGAVEVVNSDTATTTVDVATSTSDTASTTEETSGGASGTEEMQDTNTDTVPTTTDEISTTTTDIATTTVEATTTNPSIIETVTGVVETVVETITDTLETVIDAVTGTSTPTTGPEPIPEPVSEPVVNPEPVI